MEWSSIVMVFFAMWVGYVVAWHAWIKNSFNQGDKTE